MGSVHRQLHTHSTSVPSRETKGYGLLQGRPITVCEGHYYAALDYMADCLAALETNVSPQQSLLEASVRSESSSLSLKHLPPIQLPPFSGDFDGWETFRDQFHAVIIKNRDLSEFSRMHYLVSSLTGRARDAISGLAVTADNFSIAWKALTSRFGNKRWLIETHVAALYNLSNVNRESASELHALRYSR